MSPWALLLIPGGICAVCFLYGLVFERPRILPKRIDAAADDDEADEADRLQEAHADRAREIERQRVATLVNDAGDDVSPSNGDYLVDATPYQ